MEKDMRLYEMTAWFRIAAEGGLNETALAKIRDAVVAAGGEIVNQGRPSKRQLSYSIKKQREGVLAVFEVRLAPSAAKDITSTFRHEADILRVGLFEVPSAEPKKLRRRKISVPAPVAVTAGPSGFKADAEKKSEIKIEELDKKLKELLST